MLLESDIDGIMHLMVFQSLVLGDICQLAVFMWLSDHKRQSYTSKVALFQPPRTAIAVLAR